MLITLEHTMIFFRFKNDTLYFTCAIVGDEVDVGFRKKRKGKEEGRRTTTVRTHR
jgi:hypothetical protein